MSRTSDPKDQDPRVFRIHMQNKSVREITAAYYQHVSGFITFKDNDGQAVYAAREDLVSQIERLRTHVILAIAREELELILEALKQHATRQAIENGNRGPAVEANDVKAVEQALALSESLERLRPIAAARDTEDPSSLARSEPPCTCQHSSLPTGGDITPNPGCPMHRTTSDSAAA